MMSYFVSLLMANELPSRWEFIWACYGATLVVFVVLILIPIVKRNKLNQQLVDYYRRKELLGAEASRTERSDKTPLEK